MGTYQAKDTLLQKYLAKIRSCMERFVACKIWHVPREENARADILSKLVSTKPEGNNKSLIQETLDSSYISKGLPTFSIEESLGWMTSIIQYLHNGMLRNDPVEVGRSVREALYYTIIGRDLYKNGLS